MTRLTEISDHLISLECQCGHHAGFLVADLLKSLPEGSVADAVSAAPCQACGQRGSVLHMRIVHRSNGGG